MAESSILRSHKSRMDLPSEAWERLELLLERFEDAWRRGERPVIEDYLRQAGPEEQRCLLVELVHAELDYRLRAGELACVEDYLSRYPQLRGDSATAIELVLAEHALRQGRGETAAAADYLRRFPQYADALRQRLSGQSAPIVTNDVPLEMDTRMPEAALTAARGTISPSMSSAIPETLKTQHSEQRASAAGAAPPVLPGYEVLEKLGEGGMGVVYKARQTALGRVVALKMILHADRADSEAHSRFQAEAKAVASLQHPNIVQVHEVGEHHGLPFFSLEFCPGGSLDKKLSGTPLPPAEAAALVRLLAAAMQAAHDKDILHRDLKPANVLLTEDGTPKISDFGLAKKLGEQGQTRTGEVMGTPSYMAPEQASGKNKEVGPATDTYALGAILYECLTGRPPFKAATAVETMFQVVHDEPVAVRQLQPKLPRDIETICQKCLQKEPRKRYASAGALAEDLRRYLVGEPVLARPVGPVERTWRWCRRHPGVAALTATVAVVLVGSSLLAWRLAAWALGEKERAVTAQVRTRQALDEMSSEVIEDWLSKREQLEPAQRAFLEKALAYYESFAAETGNAGEVRKSVADAYLRVGNIHRNLGQIEQAGTAYQRAQELFAGLVADFPAALLYREGLGGSLHNLATMRRELGRHQAAESAYRGALDVRKQLAADLPKEPQHRENLAVSHNELGNLLEKRGRLHEAKAAYLDALTIQQQLVDDFPTFPRYRLEQSGAYNNLGLLLAKMGNPKEAEAAYREALAVAKKLAADFPAVPAYREVLAISHNNLGLLLADVDNPKEAEAAYRAAQDIHKKLAADYPTVPKHRERLAASLSNLANLLKDKSRRVKEAEDVYLEALAIQKPLAEGFPTVPLFREGLAMTYNNLGNLLRDTGRAQEAEACYQAALPLQKQLAAELTASPQARQNLARSYFNLGKLLARAGRGQDADACYREALPIFQRLTIDSPTVPYYQAQLGNTLIGLAELAAARKDSASARQLLQQARPHVQTAIKANEHQSFYRRVFHDHRQTLAAVLLMLGDHSAAAEAADELARIALYPADDSYNAACYLSLCIPLAEKDAKLSEAGRSELAGVYADRAMQSLQQAVAKGYKNVAHMKKDPDLIPLRGREDFQKLLAGLDKTAK